MNILAIETSLQPGSVAILQNDQILEEIQLGEDQRTTQSLIPAIKSLLSNHGIAPSGVDLIAVSEGPGSFTGLRIGMTVAKTFAYVTKAATIAVNTMDVIAHRVPESPKECYVVMDAQRKQLFVANYRDDGNGLRQTTEVSIESVTPWIKTLPANAIVTGPGLERVAKQLRGDIQIVESQFWTPTASNLGHVARGACATNKSKEHWKLVPNYYRKSAAEEKADQTAI